MKALLNTGMSAGIAMAILAFTGCATSAPHPNFLQPLSPSALIRANDEVTLTVQPAQGVPIETWDKERLTQRIQQALDSRKALTPALGDKKSCAVDVTITKYDKGSAFARAMLAGLGQIHINAKVKVVRLPANEQISDFTINKTFAWGGVYGASTSVEDAEVGFAEGVANALTGQEETPQTKESSKN